MGKPGSNTHNKSDDTSKRYKKCGGNKKYLAASVNSLKQQLVTVYQSIADIENENQRTDVPEGRAKLMLLLVEAPKGNTKALIEWLKIQLAKAKEDLSILKQTAADNATVADEDATATATAAAIAASVPICLDKLT